MSKWSSLMWSFIIRQVAHQDLILVDLISIEFMTLVRFSLYFVSSRYLLEQTKNKYRVKIAFELHFWYVFRKNVTSPKKSYIKSERNFAKFLPISDKKFKVNEQHLKNTLRQQINCRCLIQFLLGQTSNIITLYSKSENPRIYWVIWWAIN